MSTPEKYQRPQLRYRRFGGGYRREDVEFALAELRLTLRQLDNDLESLRDHNRDLEAELQAARREVESFQGKEHELSQMMSAVLRRATEIEEGATGRAREIIAQAEDTAMRIRSEANRGIEESGAQFNELLRLKDDLLDRMRGVVGDFDQAISRVERGEQLFPGLLRGAPSQSPPAADTSKAAPAAEPWPAQTPEPEPAAEAAPTPLSTVTPPPAPPPPEPAAAQPAPPVDQTPVPAEPAPAQEQPPAPASPAAAPPSSSAAGPSPPLEPQPAAAPPPPQAPPARPVVVPDTEPEPLFETRVELDAGPFSDFAALSAFERALAHLPKVEDVYVRRLADDRALIELTLSEAAPLLETMRATLPYSIDVRSANRAKLVVNVAAQQPAGTR
jgi:DivIVA protein